MRTVPFIKVFNKVAHWHGINPYKDIEPDTRDAIVDRINDRVLEICKVWPWPEWNVTEQRAYRQVWNAAHQYFQSVPDEVFYKQGSTYHRIRKDAPGDPPIGTLPTDTTYWEDITTGIGTYIAYDQGCRRSIGTVLGVYSQNPSGCGCNGTGKLKFHPSAHGVEICHPSAQTVFVSYQQPVPKYSMVPYAVGKTYAKADIIFDPVTGECFQALLPTIDGPDTTAWSRIPFLEKWEKYVANGAFADGMCESDRNGNVDAAQRQLLISLAEQKASDALQREVDEQTQQGQVLKWATCRRGEYWCESQPWNGGVVTEINDACESGWVFADLPPQTVPPGTFHCPTPSECPELAYLGEDNVFRNVNTIPGVRFETKEITSDYEMSVIDFSVSVDASGGTRTITLPMALGSGQFYHISKIDDSPNPVLVVTHTGDLINGESMFILGVQFADLGMIDAALGRWDRFGVGIGPPVDLSDVAFKSLVNNFLDLNTFTGVRFATKTVSDDYTLTPQDFTVLVNASAGPVTITLPLSTGNGHVYYIEKIDDTDEIVTIHRQGSDLINGSVSVNFGSRYANALLQASASAYWSNVGPFGALILPETPPATPTTLNQVITLLQSYGLCA